MTACPKCGGALTATTAATACPRCGLARERMADFAQRADAAVPVVVQAAWANVETAWHDRERHEALLRAVTEARAFAWAARQYRQAGAARPADATSAAMLQRLARTAEVVTLSGGRGKVGKRAPYRGAMLLIALGAIILVIGALFIRRMTPAGNRAAGSAAAPVERAPGLLLPADFGRSPAASPAVTPPAPR